MKIKLFGSTPDGPLILSLLDGGYDPESGRVVFIVKNDTASGTLALDVAEARKVLSILTSSTPAVERVEPEAAKGKP